MLISLTGIAVAQPAPSANAPTTCAADKAHLENRIAEAQAKGRMLLRRELAAQLAALQAGCQPLDASQGRAARVARLEKEIIALRADLAEAEGQLRALKETVGR